MPKIGCIVVSRGAAEADSTKYVGKTIEWADVAGNGTLQRDPVSATEPAHHPSSQPQFQQTAVLLAAVMADVSPRQGSCPLVEAGTGRRAEKHTRSGVWLRRHMAQCIALQTEFNSKMAAASTSLYLVLGATVAGIASLRRR